MLKSWLWRGSCDVQERTSLAEPDIGRGSDNVIERCSLGEETGAIDAGLVQLKMQRLLYLREREKYGTPVMLDLFDRERVLSDT